MKKILLCFMAVAAMTMFYSCQQNDGRCYIEGTVVGEQYEGKRIFIVPIYGPKTAEYVDSMEITNGKFHFTKDFTKDTMQMYQILLDYHYRMGVQQLLIVGEPGHIQVTIDSISSARGTPQNDSLQVWKEVTEKHYQDYATYNRTVSMLRKEGMMEQADQMAQQGREVHLAYKRYSRRMADDLKEGVLHDFLKENFPLTYKRKMPDGSIKTFNADTDEEITE
jgi:hypothetical protein